MKVDKTVTIVFFLLGILSGVIANYFYIVQNSLILALIIPLVIYIVFLFISKKFVKSKKFRWLVYNSLITYVLFWIVVWFALNAM